MSASVKICGLTRPQDIDAVVQLPIDHLGFVFAPSKRRVDPVQAGELIKALRAKEKPGSGADSAGHSVPQTVGVFVNPSKEELAEAMSHAGLDVIQLHGGESPDLCRWVKQQFPGVLLFLALPIAAGKSGEEVDRQLSPYAGWMDAVLLDTYDPANGGGTGKTFDWSVIPVYKAWTKNHGVKLIVAGGLQPGNVQELLRQYAPDGVDVSSGVETDGVKDAAKIQQFVERVKHLG